MGGETKLIHIKIAYTLIWVFVNICYFYVFYAAIKNKPELGFRMTTLIFFFQTGLINLIN